nr:hypothetical protein Iba_chr12cCG16320 [Ipomoea batatas]
MPNGERCTAEAAAAPHRPLVVNGGEVTPLPSTRRGRGGGRNATPPFCSARNREGEKELPPRRSASLSQPPASSTTTAPQHHGHTRTAGKEWTGEPPPRPPSTTAGTTTAVKPSPRARLRNSPTGRHHATSPKIRRRSLSPPGLTMFAVDAPLCCRRLKEAREKRERWRLHAVASWFERGTRRERREM